MTNLILQFAALSLVIVIAGTYLARHADALASLTGMGGTVAGLVLLAVATSLPELAVDCSAAMIGAEDIAVGTLFGSCLFNILILAVIDLTHRQRGRMLSSVAGAHAISATMCIVLTSFALLGILVQTELTHVLDREPWSIFGLDPATIGIAISYVLLFRLIYFDQRYAAAHPQAASDDGPPENAPNDSLRHATIGYVVSVVAILLAAPYLAEIADQLASESGLGETFIGTTLVAVATSLPEVVTTVVAVRIGAFDMAVGNIFGSNSFNMTILFAVDLFQSGPLLAAVEPVHGVTAISVILVTGITATGLLYRAEKRYWFLEPDSSLVIAMTVGALALVYVLS